MKKAVKPNKNTSLSFVYNLGLRYILLLLLGLFMYNLSGFYNLFLQLTAFPASLLINIFQPAKFIGDIIYVDGLAIEIIPACVAVSAYFLLLILNLTTEMNIKTRIYSIIFSFLSLLIVNILRIWLMALLLLNNVYYFELFHMFTWYVLSIVIVVAIWFITVYIFKIKNIPIYSDFKNMFKKIK